MVTVVVPEEVQEAERVIKVDRVRVSKLYYSIPCAGVKYYTYGPEPAASEDVDHVGPEAPIANL